MGTETGLENARDSGPEKAAEDSRQQGEQNVHHRGQPVQAVADEDAEEGTNVELALGPDVEEAGAKAQAHAEPEKDIRRGRDQGLGQRPWIDKGALEQGIKRLKRVGAAEGDGQAGHDEAGDDGDYRK